MFAFPRVVFEEKQIGQSDENAKARSEGIPFDLIGSTLLVCRSDITTWAPDLTAGGGPDKQEPGEDCRNGEGVVSILKRAKLFKVRQQLRAAAGVDCDDNSDDTDSDSDETALVDYDAVKRQENEEILQACRGASLVVFNLFSLAAWYCHIHVRAGAVARVCHQLARFSLGVEHARRH